MKVHILLPLILGLALASLTALGQNLGLPVNPDGTLKLTNFFNINRDLLGQSALLKTNPVAVGTLTAADIQSLTATANRFIILDDPTDPSFPGPAAVNKDYVGKLTPAIANTLTDLLAVPSIAISRWAYVLTGTVDEIGQWVYCPDVLDADNAGDTRRPADIVNNSIPGRWKHMTAGGGGGGATGPTGATGPAGPAGAAGAPGSIWYGGTTAPSGVTGIVGDRYLNTANGDHYEKTAVSTWTLRGNLTGPAGAPGSGAPGSTWFTSTGAPAGGTGIVGDFYLNSANGDFYQKTGASTWTLRGNIRGPTGGGGGSLSTDAGQAAFAGTDSNTFVPFSPGDTLAVAQALGSAIKAHTVGGSYTDTPSSASVTLTDGRFMFAPVWLSKRSTITGVAFLPATVGNFVGDAENAVGLYSYAAGTITLISKTANNEAFWKNSTGTFVQVPLAAPQTLAAGLYFVGTLYNNSAQTAAPTVRISVTLANAVQSQMDLAFPWVGYVAGQASMPTTLDLTTTTGQQAVPVFFLY